MNIIICDDDKNIPGLLIPYINNIENHFSDIEIFYFKNGKDLIEWSKKNSSKIDILFIDIEMPTMDGLETVKLLRAMGEDCIIIYISCHKEYVFDTLNYEIFNYLVKPLNSEILINCLSAAIERYKKNHYIHEVYCDGNHYFFHLDDIYYIESFRRQVTYYTKTGEYTVFDQISKLEKIFEPYGFLRSHKSYLINMSKVVRYKDCMFYLVGGGTAMISNRQRSDILKKYYEYIKKKIF